MLDTGINTNVRYDAWAKQLNRNTKFKSNSKVKPQVPFSHLADKEKNVKREKKFSTSEIWLG